MCTMERILNVYKPQGMTPLQLLDRLRERCPEYKSEKMTYAGRLDPMAEGVLVVLVGEAVYDKEKYLALDKVYEADIVFGFGTDTYDVLGLPTIQEMGEVSDGDIGKEMQDMEGEREYPFPIYSSKPVNGRPLFWWAREGRLDEIDIPARMMRIYGMELLERYAVSVKTMEAAVKNSIEGVWGDFRQDEIMDGWRALFDELDRERMFPAVRIRVHCASGTYIRTIAHELGRRLGTDAVLMRLIRIRVGEFDKTDSMHLDG